MKCALCCKEFKVGDGELRWHRPGDYPNVYWCIHTCGSCWTAIVEKALRRVFEQMPEESKPEKLYG